MYLQAEHARLFISAEIEFAELFLGEIEKVERLIHEAALDQFLRDDAAERFDVERLALREVFHAPGLLRGATGDVLAAPRNFFCGVARRTRRERSYFAILFLGSPGRP